MGQKVVEFSAASNRQILMISNNGCTGVFVNSTFHISTSSSVLHCCQASRQHFQFHLSVTRKCRFIGYSIWCVPSHRKVIMSCLCNRNKSVYIPRHIVNFSMIVEKWCFITKVWCELLSKRVAKRWRSNDYSHSSVEWMWLQWSNGFDTSKLVLNKSFECDLKRIVENDGKTNYRVCVKYLCVIKALI